MTSFQNCPESPVPVSRWKQGSRYFCDCACANQIGSNSHPSGDGSHKGTEYRPADQVPGDREQAGVLLHDCKHTKASRFLRRKPQGSVGADKRKRRPEGRRFSSNIVIEIRDLVFLTRFGGDLLSHVLRRSTIGATALNDRVRDGIGCFARAMTTKPRKEHIQAAYTPWCMLRSVRARLGKSGFWIKSSLSGN